MKKFIFITLLLFNSNIFCFLQYVVEIRYQMCQPYYDKKEEKIISLIEQYLEKRGDLNAWWYNETLLHMAASLGCKSTVVFLLKKGAKVDVGDKNRRPVIGDCLHFPKIVEILKDAGANPHAMMYDKTVLEYCFKEIEDFKKKISEKDCRDQFYYNRQITTLEKSLDILTGPHLKDID